MGGIIQDYAGLYRNGGLYRIGQGYTELGWAIQDCALLYKTVQDCNGLQKVMEAYRTVISHTDKVTCIEFVVFLKPD